MHSLKKVLHTSMVYAVSIMLVGVTPATFVNAADEPATYTYDAANQRWNTDQWVYDSNTGVYVPASTAQTTAPPASSNDTPLSVPSTENGTDPNQTVQKTDSSTSDSNKASQDTSIKNSATIDNTLNADSISGGANVVSNLKAGDAKTGTADAITTTVNSVHSTIDGDTQGIAHFTTNIYGDVTGDITIGPSIDKATIDKSIILNSNTNVQNSDTITNNLNVSAASGDANVKSNTDAGDATSGNANAVANVLNLINTIIAANKSFVGTINIYGNLNGDILVSPDFIPQLLASNADNKVNISMPLSMSTNVNDDQAIINNIKLQATSGNANVKDNTGAGSATTGMANTNLTVLNLTGHEIDAKKSLLVFVNVLGKWVGMIVDAPGATAAAFGSGVTNNEINVTDTTNISNASRILNNINLAAKSGDANVVGNTLAGNATTGNATASANIANISTSTIKLSDWFGILFINVFGTWVGSFGIDTNAGTVVPLGGMALPDQQPINGSPNLAFGFIPRNGNEAKLSAPTRQDNYNSPLDKQAALSFASDNDMPFIPGAPNSNINRNSSPSLNSTMMTTGGFAATLASLSGALMLARRRNRNQIISQRSGLVLPH